jgi:hypothetical protein
LTIDNLVDLSIPFSLQSFIQNNYPEPKIRKWAERAHVLDLMKLILPKSKGGNKNTNWLGWAIKENGYNGVVFPSIRCLEKSYSLHLEYKGFYGRLHLHDFKTYASDGVSLKEEILYQMYHETCIIIYSGSLLTRCSRFQNIIGLMVMNIHRERKMSITG